MPAMPLSYEKGPYLLIIEDFLEREGVEGRVRLLRQLRAGVPIAELEVFGSESFSAGPLTREQRVAHLHADMFGRGLASGAWAAQAPFDLEANPTTGHFPTWYGDAEGIFRQASIRGLEVSLGLAHGEEPGDDVDRCWTIELFLNCPHAFMEGWVTWRRHGDGARDGQVTVMYAIPGEGCEMIASPRRPQELQANGYVDGPTEASEDQGMWVVAHERQVVHAVDATVRSGLGEWPRPALASVVESQGEVVCVSPSEVDGGVRPGGRAFEPVLGAR